MLKSPLIHVRMLMLASETALGQSVNIMLETLGQGAMRRLRRA